MKFHSRIWRGAVLALLFLLLTSSIGFSQSDTQGEIQAELQALPPGWKIETIDDGRIIAELGQNSLAYGPGGVPHVAYGGDHLYHAYRAGGEWGIQLVDSSPQVGKNASIAVDSLGHVYITYYDELNQDLKYATNWKGWWEYLTLASPGNVGTKSFVFAIMGEGQQGPDVYVGYLDTSTHKVMFIYSEEAMMGYWSGPEIISGNLNVTNFAMTMRGYQAFVSLASGGNIYYATSTNWAGIELVDEGQSVTAIAVTDDSTPYIPITYHDSYWGWITYLAYRENGIWVSPTQANPYNLIFSLDSDLLPEALSIRADGNAVYVAMQLPGSSTYYHDLYIAHGAKEIYLGDSYTVQANAGGNIFPAVAASLDTIDLQAGVIYLNGNLLEYQFLPSMTNTWSKNISPVDTSSDFGKCAVVKTDNSGKLHLMYYRSDTGALLYKYSTPTGWSTARTITNSGEWATCNSLARPGMDLDSLGRPVFVYVNFDHQLIFKDRNCVGRDCLSNHVVDTGLNSGLDGSASIAMGNGDSPFILYHKNQTLTLAYDLTPATLNWTINPVPGAPTTYGGISLETDNDGRLHAGFVYDVMDYPYYARFDGNVWSGLKELDSDNYTMDPVRVAVSPKTNTPQVAYANNFDQLVITAYTQLPNTTWVWLPSIIDTPPDGAGSLGNPAFAINTNGARLLAYDYSSPQQGINGLKFMKIEGAVKSPQIIETTPGRLDSTSIALRPGDVPVIAYHLPALGSVKVAWGPNNIYLPLIKR